MNFLVNSEQNAVDLLTEDNAFGSDFICSTLL